MEKTSYIYILSNKKNGTLYTGVTSNIVKRVWQHKQKITKGFTTKYGINKLVYFEIHADIMTAIAKEKRLKKWPRQWKLELIEKSNPTWRDLYLDLL